MSELVFRSPVLPWVLPLEPDLVPHDERGERRGDGQDLGAEELDVLRDVVLEAIMLVIFGLPGS